MASVKQTTFTRAQAAAISGVDPQALATLNRRDKERKLGLLSIQEGDEEGGWTRYTPRQVLTLTMMRELSRGTNWLTEDMPAPLALKIASAADEFLDGHLRNISGEPHKHTYADDFFAAVALLSDTEIPEAARKSFHAGAQVNGVPQFGGSMIFTGSLPEVAAQMSEFKMRSPLDPHAFIAHNSAAWFRAAYLINVTNAASVVEERAEGLGFKIEPDWQLARKVKGT